MNSATETQEMNTNTQLSQSTQADGADIYRIDTTTPDSDHDSSAIASGGNRTYTYRTHLDPEDDPNATPVPSPTPSPVRLDGNDDWTISDVLGRWSIGLDPLDPPGTCAPVRIKIDKRSQIGTLAGNWAAENYPDAASASWAGITACDSFVRSVYVQLGLPIPTTIAGPGPNSVFDYGSGSIAYFFPWGVTSLTSGASHVGIKISPSQRIDDNCGNDGGGITERGLWDDLGTPGISDYSDLYVGAPRSTVNSNLSILQQLDGE